MGRSVAMLVQFAYSGTTLCVCTLHVSDSRVVWTGQTDLVEHTADEQARVALSPFMEVECHPCVTPHTKIIVHREVDWRETGPKPSGRLDTDRPPEGSASGNQTPPTESTSYLH